MQYIAYFSISGENKISIYQMDPDTGDLSLLNHVTVDGTPAPLVVDSEQAYLYAGLRSTEQIAVFEINQSDGQHPNWANQDPIELMLHHLGSKR